MSGYSFEAFLQQVCDSPDLEIIHEFNREYREYLQKMSIAVNSTVTSASGRSSSNRSLRSRGVGMSNDLVSELASRDGVASISSGRSRSRMNAAIVNTGARGTAINRTRPFTLEQTELEHSHSVRENEKEEDEAWKRMTSSWQHLPLPLNEEWVQTVLLHHNNLVNNDNHENGATVDLNRLNMIIYHNYKTRAEIAHFRAQKRLYVFDALSGIAIEGSLEHALQTTLHSRKCWHLLDTGYTYETTCNSLSYSTENAVSQPIENVSKNNYSTKVNNSSITWTLRDIKLESLPAFSVYSTKHISFASCDEELILTCDHAQYCSLHSLYYAQCWDRLNSTWPITIYGAHISAITDVCISPNYALLATCSMDHTLCVFDLQSGKCLWSIIHPIQLDCVTFSADGVFIITGAVDQRCRVWYATEANKQRPLLIYREHSSPVIALTSQSSHNLVASAGVNGEVHVWQANTALSQFILNGELHNHNRVISLQFSINGRLLLSADVQRVVIHDVANHGCTLLSITPPALRGVRFATHASHEHKYTRTAALAGGSSNVNLLFTTAMLIHPIVFTEECVLFATNDGTITLHELNTIYTAQNVSGLQNLELLYNNIRSNNYHRNSGEKEHEIKMQASDVSDRDGGLVQSEHHLRESYNYASDVRKLNVKKEHANASPLENNGINKSKKYNKESSIVNKSCTNNNNSSSSVFINDLYKQSCDGIEESDTERTVLNILQGNNSTADTQQRSNEELHDQGKNVKSNKKNNNHHHISEEEEEEEEYAGKSRSIYDDHDEDNDDDNSHYLPQREVTLRESDIKHNSSHNMKSAHSNAKNITPSVKQSERFASIVHSKRIVVELKPSMWFTTLRAPVCSYAIGSHRRILLVDVNGNIYVMTSIVVERANTLNE